MAKHHIKMVCGHTETHEIYGPMKDRPRKATAISYRQCHDCNSNDNLQRGAQAATANAAAGLPILKGSPKQIAWAESIRETALAEDAEWLAVTLDVGRKQVEAGEGTEAQYDLLAAQLNGGYAALRHEASATYWIDSRSSGNGARVKAKARDFAKV